MIESLRSLEPFLHLKPSPSTRQNSGFPPLRELCRRKIKEYVISKKTKIDLNKLPPELIAYIIDGYKHYNLKIRKLNLFIESDKPYEELVFKCLELPKVKKTFIKDFYHCLDCGYFREYCECTPQAPPFEEASKEQIIENFKKCLMLVECISL